MFMRTNTSLVDWLWQGDKISLRYSATVLHGINCPSVNVDRTITHCDTQRSDNNMLLHTCGLNSILTKVINTQCNTQVNAHVDFIISDEF